MNNLLGPWLERAQGLILGKEEPLKIALSTLLAQGHLLIEDVPGVGKTTLALFLAKTFDLPFTRLQFTVDLLPADLLGGDHFEKGDIVLKKGPIFTHLLLADEINRAGPKTQSALLQAMEEREVSLEGHTYPLPSPFMVMATQNPREQQGVFPLPESQLDRFMVRFEIGHLESSFEERLLLSPNPRDIIKKMDPIMSGNTFHELREACEKVYVAQALASYIARLLQRSRQRESLLGLSSRAGQDLLKLGRAWSFLQGEKEVYPEVIYFLTPFVINHRLSPHLLSVWEGIKLAQELLDDVAVP